MQGLTVLSPGYPEIKVDIVFVHGLRGHALDTWTKGPVCWPRDLLNLDVPEARILTWGYDSSVARTLEFASQSSLFGHAENLLTDLVNKRRGASEKTRPIIFVGHSLGGLVVKQTLIRANTMLLNGQDPRRGAIYQYTRGVVFLGTPHRGSDREAQAGVIAKIAQLAYCQPNRQLLETLASNSHILENQRTAFDSITRDLRIVCCYEEKPTAVGLIVPESSACMDGFQVRKNGIPDNHMDMAKFEDPDSAGYQRTVGYLQEWICDIEAGGDNKLDDHGSCNPCETSQYPPMLNVPDIQTDHKVHESLKFDTMDDRFYGVERQYNKTFEWLFENETLDFPDWLRSGRKIFWITGKAGSGKSTLMKYAFSDPRTLRMLEENGGNGDRPFLAQFFFHGRGTTLQKSFKGLLQSVLYEILNHYPDLIPHILPNHVGKEWRLETLKASFLKLFTKQFNRSLKVCLFIDGLDEFEGDHDEIADFFLAGIEQSVHRIQLCVSSRPLPVFLHHFRTCPRIEMHEQTRYDIRCYVTERLDETVQMRILRQLHQFEVEDFISDLIDKGSGVFLWARLAVKSLIKGLNNGENIKELRSRLRQLPSELGDLFQTMLDSIDPSGGREAAEILQLVSIAENQSSLFLIYLALGYPASVLDRSDTEFELQQVEALRTTASLLLQSRCAGLVEVVKYDGSGTALCVQFLHQSVKDFVNQADTWASLKARSRPQFSPSRALLAAVVRCVQCELVSGYHIVYESSMVAHFGHYARFAEIETGQAQTCMLQELIRLCNIHYRKANGKSCDDIDEGIPADLNFIKEAPEWIDELFRNVAIKFIRPSLIFYAVWYDIPLTIRLTMEAYLESTDEVSEIMDKLLYFRTLGLFSYEYPDQGHEPLQTLRFLIQHGANPNADVLEIGKSTWRSFLHGLCCEFPPGPPGPSRGCNATELLRVIELFIHSGADIHAWIPCAGNCLGFWVRQPCIENPSQTKFPVSASAVVREFSSYMGRSEKAKLQQILDGMAQRGAEEIFAYEPVP